MTLGYLSVGVIFDERIQVFFSVWNRIEGSVAFQTQNAQSDDRM